MRTTVRLRVEFGFVRNSVPNNRLSLPKIEPMRHRLRVGDDNAWLALRTSLETLEDAVSLFARHFAIDDLARPVLQFCIQQTYYTCQRGKD